MGRGGRDSPGLGSVVGGSFFSNLLCVFLGTNLLGKGANEYGGAFFFENKLFGQYVRPSEVLGCGLCDVGSFGVRLGLSPSLWFQDRMWICACEKG